MGQSSTVGGDPHAFRWDLTNSMVDLGTLGGTNSIANAINDAGQVVGQSQTSTGEFHAFVWDPSNLMQNLGTHGGSISDAADINAVGLAVGRSIIPPEHAALWNVTAISPIPPVDISILKSVNSTVPFPGNAINYTINSWN